MYSLSRVKKHRHQELKGNSRKDKNSVVKTNRHKKDNYIYSSYDERNRSDESGED